MSIATRISTYNRYRKWDLFMKMIQPTPATRVLDVGFSDKEYSPVYNLIEKQYPYPEKLTALGVIQPDEFIWNYPLIKVIRYNGKDFPFKDWAFDVCWSNAVLEHVGGLDQQVSFLKEIKRTCRKAFITTPNKNFPIEIHTRTPFLHYLPKDLFETYLRWVHKNWATGDYMHLLIEKDIHRLLNLANIKEYQITPNKLLCYTLDYVIKF